MEKELEYLGLTKNEVKVYLTLLKSGPSTAVDISKKGKMHRTNTYDSLTSLSDKGLVTYVLKGKVKYFQASDPRKIKVLLDEKEEAYKQILPELNSIKKIEATHEKVHIYEGVLGIKAVTDDILSEGKEVYTFGVPRDVSEKMKSFVGIYHKRRIKAKMRQYHIYNQDARERIKFLNSLPYTKAAYLPKDYDSPVTTTVYAGKVAFFIWSEPPFGILIESKRMAKSYKNYFDILWKFAKKN
ncbi:MAG: hypothetical protein HYS32_01160 [Candidatus Woesearchaeota archaeon]|nr:MAG: hypothetical protein HYS32_01160 [Candidatus Woesearchaeota archaeon]